MFDSQSCLGSELQFSPRLEVRLSVWEAKVGATSIDFEGRFTEGDLTLARGFDVRKSAGTGGQVLKLKSESLIGS